MRGDKQVGNQGEPQMPKIGPVAIVSQRDHQRLLLCLASCEAPQPPPALPTRRRSGRYPAAIGRPLDDGRHGHEVGGR
jgi:hypothetical protein